MPMSNVLPDPVIKHVVVLMLENRGFDHIMGWLHARGPIDQADYRLESFPGDNRPFLGLSNVDLDSLKNPMPISGQLVPIKKGARSPRTPQYNTGETFEHIMNQMWALAEPEAVWFNRASREGTLRLKSDNGATPPSMKGYLLDYDMDVFHHVTKHLGKEDLSEVLDTYLPEQMPVLSGLARAYAVSDEWFCSVPSQTNTNRAFAMTGTSRGMVNNSFYDPPDLDLAIARRAGEGKSHCDALPVSTRSMFEVLQEANLSWKVYWQAEWPPWFSTIGQWQYTRTMIPLLQDKAFDQNFVKFDANDPQSRFYRDARRGELPAVTWIEPKWGGGAQWDSIKRLVGNDYHPVCDTTTGEDFVMNVYQAISARAEWDDTLLIITFDENGGTYDHVVPPGATPAPVLPGGGRGALLDPRVVHPPGNQACPLPHPKVSRGDMDPENRTQYGFDFDQLGIRVPTILISPRIRTRTIFRSREPGKVFDHTSTIATILKLGQIPKGDWMLGERVANAPTFEHMIIQTPRPPARQAAQAPPQPQPVQPQPAQGGQQQPALALNDQSAPLSVPELRSNGADVLFDTPYLLKWVGDPWSEPPAHHMSRSGSGLIPTYYYPSLTDNPAQALPFTFSATGDGGAAVYNMSPLRIATTERSVMGWVWLTVSNINHWVYYSGDLDNSSAWQIRLLGSRESGDRVKVGDYVYFLTQHDLIKGDPFQRLVPSINAPGYVTTRAGEWGLWQILPVPPRPVVAPHNVMLHD